MHALTHNHALCPFRICFCAHDEIILHWFLEHKHSHILTYTPNYACMHIKLTHAQIYIFTLITHACTLRSLTHKHLRALWCHQSPFRKILYVVTCDLSVHRGACVCIHAPAGSHTSTHKLTHIYCFIFLSYCYHTDTMRLEQTPWKTQKVIAAVPPF